MKKILSVLLVAVLLLAGCSASTVKVATDAEYNVVGSTGSAEAPMQNGNYDNGYYDKGDYDYGWAEDSATGDSIESDPIQSGAILENDKIIYTADVTLETRDFDLANGELSALVASLGGYFESRQLNQGSSYRSVYCVIRVPADRFAEFISRSGEVAHLTACNERSTNVSEAYYDLESRLATQRIKLERLQELLAQAKDMYDITTILSEISNTEWQIENLTRQIRGYDNQIAYSTINLSLREVYRLSDEEPAPVTFGDRIAVAFDRGIDQLVENMEDLVLFAVQNWLNLIIWGVIIAAAVVWIRRYRRKRRSAMGNAKNPADRTDEN